MRLILEKHQSVARLIRANGKVVITRRKFKATTISNRELPVSADLVGQALGYMAHI